MKKNKLTKKSNKNVKVFILLVISLIFVGIAASVAIVGCSYMENQTFKETFYNVSSLKVNNNVRIIQISDLHNAVFGNNNNKLVDRIDKLNPDIILYTGDCIDSDIGKEDSVIDLCRRLAEIAPSYYIYGNNEVLKYYDDPLTQYSLDKKFGFDDSNRDPAKLLEITDTFTQALEEVGVTVLKNSTASITVGTTNVDVYGVLTSNPSSFWSYAGQSFDEYMYSNEANLKVMAIHEPNVFEEYLPDSWGDLMFAGHTHGGVAKIPMLGPAYTHDGGVLPESSGHYVYGRYEVQGRPLVVSSGLDNSSFFRINNQPEIVIVDVKKF